MIVVRSVVLLSSLMTIASVVDGQQQQKQQQPEGQLVRRKRISHVLAISDDTINNNEYNINEALEDLFDRRLGIGGYHQ